jgi:hypothetical protein
MALHEFDNRFRGSISYALLDFRLRNKPLRDRRALGVKLVRAVRSFAEQNEPCLTDKRQQRIVILRAASQRLNRFADDCRVAHGQLFCSARTSSAQPKLPLKRLILP